MTLLYEKLLFTNTVVYAPHNILYMWGSDSIDQLGDTDATFANKSSPVQITTLSWKQLSLGDSHTMAIRTDNTLWGWGLNNQGQLGFPNGPYSSPVLVPYAVSWSQVSFGTSNSYGIKTDGTLWAWGLNNAGQLGNNSTVNASVTPVLVSGPANTSWIQVSAGNSWAHAITNTNALYGWGLNTSGQLGINSLTSTSSPVAVYTPSMVYPTWSQISAGASHVLAINSNGLLYAWGNNASGQLGTGGTANTSYLVLVSGPAGASWSRVSAGVSHSLAITTTNLLYSWGGNTAGQLGINATVSVSSPVLVSGPATTSWASIAAGDAHSLAITRTGLLYGWGSNTSGQLGITATTNKSSPVLVSGPATTSWSLASAGTIFSLALTNLGVLYAWGNNNAGQLGTVVTANTSSPVLVSGPTGASWSSISAGVSHTIGITTNNLLYGWGGNTSGQLGINATTNSSSPVLVSGPATTSWSTVSAGGSLSVATTTTGLLYAWGGNTSGQVGINLATPRSSPVLVSGPATTSWNLIAAGADDALAATSAGLLYAWGNNNAGQLGNNTITGASSPVTVFPGFNTTQSWSSVNASTFGTHTFGITNTGLLYGWGLNTSGQLGTISTVTVSWPVLASGPAATSWSSASAGDVHSLGITTTGLLYAWGNNTSGQVGIGNTVSSSSPVLVSGPATTSWSYVDSGISYSLALTNTGVLYTWGNNNAGQMGNYTTASLSSPVSIAVPTNWVKIAANQYHTMGITSTGLLYGWGYNNNGQLGINSTVNKSSPVLVSGPTGASWNSISCGYFQTIGITTTGLLYGWGYNTSGQLGINSTVNTSSPVLVSGPTGASWSIISAGGSHTMGITSTGLLYGWGLNNNGQLGIINSGFNTSSPVLVSGPTGASWNNVSAGIGHTMGITTTGILYGWGLNTSGQLGINSTVNTSSPVLVSGPTGVSWTNVAAGISHTMGITSTGLLYGWGGNTSGQVGINTIANTSSPVLVSGPTGASWTSVSAGGQTTLGITKTGLLYGWGRNVNAQLGINSTVNTSSPVLVSGPTGASWTSVSASVFTGLAITTAGLLYAWGTDNYGQLGNNYAVAAPNISSPVIVIGGSTPSWSNVSAGASYVLGIANNLFYGWGLNTSGQLGVNSTANNLVPFLVSGPTSTSWSQVTAGYYHAGALTTSGILYGWGSDSVGESVFFTRNSPVQIGTSSWSAVGAGNSYTLGILANGRLYAWGANTSGQLGVNTTTANSSPVLVSGPTNTSWSQITAGYAHSLAITSTGTLYAWGDNAANDIGLGSVTTPVSSPVAVYPPAITQPSWANISAGSSHSLGITSDGILYAWGNNNAGQLGNISTTNSVFPILVSGPANTSWSTVSAGLSTSLAIANTGTLYAWGGNASGQIGNNSSVSVSSPVTVYPTNNYSWFRISSGFGHTMGITSTGILYGWGRNTSGQLGNGAISPRSTSPVLVSGPAGASWISVSAGYEHTMGITTTGLLYGWGGNTSGQLGITTVGGIASSSFPILVSGPTGASWTSVATGTYHTLGITTAGILYSWGLNANGQLGTNSIANTSSPVLVSGPTGASWTSVATNAFGSHTMGITSTGLLYGWGLNTSGQIGVNSTVSASSPVLVSGPTGASWINISAGGNHTIGIATTGILYAWGFNNAGQLGTNSTTNTSSPVLVSGPAGASWSSISAGSSHTIGITATGLLYGWGLNNSGMVGINSTVNISSPVLVSGPTGTSWSIFSAGSNHTAAITSTGLLYTWGLNSNAQLGINTTLSTSSPVTVAPIFTGTDTTQSWIAVSTSQNGQHTLGITANGELWTWGLNNTGQLGNITAFTVSWPILTSGSAATSWSSVSAGDAHSLAITNTGILYGWGNNTSGQIGTNTTTNISSPVLVSGPATTSWSTVGAGTSFSLALTNTGILYAWGLNNAGQIGNFNTVSQSSPVAVTLPATWAKIAAGQNHTMGITSTGLLYGWGLNTNGQLGINSAVNKSSPVLVSGPTGASWNSISCGYFQTIGITTTGLLYGWGQNNNGQLGTNSIANTSSPALVSGPTGASWSIISAGAHTMGITSTGLLYSWGQNADGQLGINSTFNKSSPVLVSGPSGASWTSVSAGGYHTMGITTAGLLYGWGYNNFGELGINSGFNASSPVLVSGPTGASWTSVSAGGYHTMGITTAGLLYGWGHNNYGELGINSIVSTSLPVLVNGPTGASWHSVFCGYGQTNAFTISGSNVGPLYGWGYNVHGELGINSTVNISSPVLVSGPTGTRWTSVSAGYEHTMGITTAGLLYGWGYNNDGQLGINSTVSTSSPVLVASVNGGIAPSWSSVSAGASHVLGVTNNLLYGWGLNTSGQLGISSTVNNPFPVLISGPASTSWSQVAAGAIHSLASTSTGILEAWGSNNAGQLGVAQPTTVTASSPVAVVAFNTNASWSQIAAGQSHSLGITSAGQLYAWGDNTYGELGLNNTATVYYPNLVSATRSFTAVSAGGSHSMVIDTNNTLYTWGNNQFGQLGTSDTVNRSSPVALVFPNFSTIAAFAGGANHSLAITTKGQLWAWGQNTSGQLGDNTSVSKSSPIIVATSITSSWTAVGTGAGALHSGGITL